MTRTTSAWILALTPMLLVLASCSGDDGGEESVVSSTTEPVPVASETAENTTTSAPVTSEPATSTSTTSLPQPPPAPDPGTVVIEFDDGERSSVPVTCQLEPAGEFAAQVESEVGALPFFGLLVRTNPERTPEATWQTEDEMWAAGAPVGTELDVEIDGNTVRGTTLYRNPTGQDRVEAFTAACA